MPRRPRSRREGDRCSVQPRRTLGDDELVKIDLTCKLFSRRFRSRSVGGRSDHQGVLLSGRHRVAQGLEGYAHRRHRCRPAGVERDVGDQLADFDVGDTVRASEDEMVSQGLAVREVEGMQGEPVGTLRLCIRRLAFEPIVERALPRFRVAYPNVAIDVSVRDGPIDLIAEGFDVGVRIWEFRDGDRDLRVRPPTPLIVNDARALCALAEQGMGLAYTSDLVAEQVLRERRLHTVLLDFSPPEDALYLYYPAGSRDQPKIRAFVDAVIARATSDSRPAEGGS